MTFVSVWIGYAVFGAIVSSVVFVWAVRSRQFTELDRQRYLAINAADAVENEPSGRQPARIDRYTWVGLLLLTVALICAALWFGYRTG